MAVPTAYQPAPDLAPEPLAASEADEGRKRLVADKQRDPLLRRMLAAADIAAVSAAILAASAFERHGVVTTLAFALMIPVWVVLAKVHGLYDRDRHALRHLSVDEVPTLFAWAMSGTLATMLLLVSFPTREMTVRTGLLVWASAAVLAFTFRGLVRCLWRAITQRERILILGEGRPAEAVARKLALFPDIHGVLVDARPAWEVDPSTYEHELEDIDRIIVASSWIDESLIATLLGICRRQRIKLTVVPPSRGMFGTAVQLNHVADLPVVEFNTGDVPSSTLFLKRSFDVAASAAALVVLAPVFLAIAIAIRLDSRGPVIFSQTRAGQDGRPFRMFKFRTMVPKAEDMLADLLSFDHLKEPVFKIQNDPRVTRVGRLLRRTSLDELPQLVNILLGHMSVVGPRPEQIDLVERYTDEQAFRLAVKPGLTGPMQIFGRGHLTLEERLAVEREYIENLSLGRDLMIIALTLSPLVSGKGAF